MISSWRIVTAILLGDSISFLAWALWWSKLPCWRDPMPIASKKLTIFSVTVQSQRSTHHLMITLFPCMWSCCTPIFTNYRKIIVFVNYFLGNRIFTLILSSKIYVLCKAIAKFPFVKTINKDSLFLPFFSKRHCLNHTHGCTHTVKYNHVCQLDRPSKGRKEGRKPNPIWV